MTNVAYKLNSDNPNLPIGFITDSFETEESAVEGYHVCSKEVFSTLLAGNVDLMRSFENRVIGIKEAHPNLPEFPRRSNQGAEPVDQVLMAEKKKQIEDAMKAQAQNQADAELFQQFLAWKRSQEPGS